MTDTGDTPFAPVFEAVDGGGVEVQVPEIPESGPVMSLLAEAFGDQSVEISETVDGLGSRDDSADSTVRLVEDGEVVATSPLTAVMDTFLLVNSDMYRTGTSGVDEHEAPEVLTALDETVFTVRGYPDSTKEKLLLILISRFIENRALTVGAGRIDSSFQRLSRLDDETGTRAVYSRLAESDVDVHVYGVGDATPLSDASVTRHTGGDRVYRRTWVVVYSSPSGDESVALVAIETAPNTWRGIWTFRDSLVERTRRIVKTAF